MAARFECSQQEWVKQQLFAGKRLNHLNLIADCGGRAGWRLGAVIHALSNDPDEPLSIQREYSGRRRMATYWLEPNKQKRSQLKLPLHH